MEFSRDERFVEQRRRFHLRHTCEFCAFFDAATGACVHGWPNDRHREQYYDPSEGQGGDRIVFCKEFEFSGDLEKEAHPQDQNPGAKAANAAAMTSKTPVGANRAPTRS